METISLNDLGFTNSLKNHQKENKLEAFTIGRVILEHKDRYVVKTETDELESELIGNLRFNVQSKHDLPIVGDWVAISEYDDNKALIQAIYPRNSILERKAVGKVGQTQIIASNIDYGIIVQSVNRDFSLNRIERYLTICNASKIEPKIILSKTDLIDENKLNEILNSIKDRVKNIALYAISNTSLSGIEELKSIFIKGKTYCVIGSSGVGKSTLINTIIGVNKMNTGAISKSIDRGKHITSHRELIVFENGILIDNPGIREVGITDLSGGIKMTFVDIFDLTENCKFNDCSHTNEKGCAVLKALGNNELDEESFVNFQKMERERDYFESTVTEKKQQGKDLAKLIRQNKKRRGNNKY